MTDQDTTQPAHGPAPGPAPDPVSAPVAPPVRPGAENGAETGAGPVTGGARVESMDVLRGFAMLGILVPNIVVFGWPQVAMYDPTFMGESGWNQLGYRVTSVFFLGKMMMLFAMLFGGGVVFFARRYDARQPHDVCRHCGYSRSGLMPDAVCPECGRAGARASYVAPLSRGAGRWYTRIGWLLAIGLLHAYGLWYGDILVMYAVAGATLLWWVRRFSARTLLVSGIASYALGTLILLGIALLMQWVVSMGKVAESDISADPVAELEAYRGDYADAFRTRAFTLIFMHIGMIPLMTPMILGLMLMGMALVKSGVFTAERSVRFYGTMALGGLLGGGLLTALLFVLVERSGLPLSGFLWQLMAQPVGIPLGLGYAGFLLLLVRTGMLPWVRGALAAVGRMALTNYLMQTVICTTIFYGYGLASWIGTDVYATVEYPWLFGIVAGVWTINIVFSLLWSRWFRFGPAEWLWRSLTYCRVQPIRR